MLKKYRYIVELGSANISIFSTGLVLRQPNVAVIRKGHGLELIAAGNDALKMQSELPEHCTFTRPVEEGAVVYPEVMSLVLEKYFSQIAPKKILKAVEIYVLVSPGLSLTERENIELSVAKAGYKDVTLIENIDGLLPYFGEKAAAALICGAGVTDIGVLSDKGIVTACSINLAGDALDEKIIDRVLEVYNMNIGPNAARYLKEKIAGLYENDTSVAEVRGRDLLDGRIKTFEVSASGIKPAVFEIYDKIAEVIGSVMQTVPAALLPEIRKNGLYVAGGGANMRGLAGFFIRKLGIPVRILDDPETAALRGVSTALSSPAGRYFFDKR